MAVYPFYVEINSSTRKTNTSVNTRDKDGTMVMHIHQRDNGCITNPYKIRQYSVHRNGKHLLVTDILYLDKVIHSHETEY